MAAIPPPAGLKFRSWAHRFHPARSVPRLASTRLLVPPVFRITCSTMCRSCRLTKYSRTTTRAVDPTRVARCDLSKRREPVQERRRKTHPAKPATLQSAEHAQHLTTPTRHTAERQARRIAY